MTGTAQANRCGPYEIAICPVQQFAKATTIRRAMGGFGLKEFGDVE